MLKILKHIQETKEMIIIFEPSAEEIYPKEYKSIQNSHFKNILCDQYRPGHFDGVVTVLNRLFSIIESDKVYFGQKDFQQLKIVENLIKENFPNLKLVPVSTVRSDAVSYTHLTLPTILRV